MTTFTSPEALRKQLRTAGISNDAISAAWPAWWSDDALGSPSAEAELRFALARNLGLSAPALLHEEPVFVWRGRASFKRSSLSSEQDEAVLTSFGHTVGRLVAAAAHGSFDGLPSAREAREAILSDESYVSLGSLLSLCWGIGVPVVYQQVFPLAAKRMDAMSVRVEERPVILLARRTEYGAFLAFMIAHELGHIANGHLGDGESVIDISESEGSVALGEDPFSRSSDAEERAADAYAFELLTGNPNFTVASDRDQFNPAQVVAAVLTQAPEIGVDPGFMALSLGHSSGRWATIYAAMNQLQLRDDILADRINLLAYRNLQLDRLGEDSRAFLLRVLGSGALADA